MKRTILAAMVLLAGATLASAQQPEGGEGARSTTDDVRTTPEMWFYERELERYNDPKVAVRKKAELRAAQRMQRIAAQRWYGISLARPLASPTPVTSTFGQTWVSNTTDPFRWSGMSRGGYLVPAQSSPSFFGLW